MEGNCSFCTTQENKDREILRNEFVWAFPTRIPIVPGHVLICPTRCVATFEELTTDERNAIFAAMTQIKDSLRKTFNAKGFNHAWNEHVVGGQSVPHFHLHILPRTEEDEVRYGFEPRQFLYRSTATRELSPQEELKEVAELIKENLT
jgi:diadenosine tetraphosphate (Ap4A) HIT family hydrolase